MFPNCAADLFMHYIVTSVEVDRIHTAKVVIVA
jgi:hypothetical protein